MQRQILEFLRMNKMSETILNGDPSQQGEMTFSISGEEATLVRLSPNAFIFEMGLVTLPTAYSERNHIINAIMANTAFSVFLSDVIVGLDENGGRVVLQKFLDPSLKSGAAITAELIDLLKINDWWYNQLGAVLGKRRGSGSSPEAAPVIFG